MPTEKLFDLIVKYSDYLSREGLDLILTQKKTCDDVLLIDPDVEEWKG